MKKILHNNRGNVLVQTVGIILMLLIIIIPVYHYCRILTIANGINNAFRNEMIKTVSANYEHSFNGMREQNSGAYKLQANRWLSSIENFPVVRNITTNLSLNQNGNSYTKTDTNGKIQYSISNIQINIKNADFASSETRLTAHATYTLNVPIHIFFTDVEQSYNMHTDVEFEPKF